MKDFAFNQKKKDQNIISVLNTLIYEYLVKMKFDKSAKTFACEAYIEDVKLSDNPPLLSQWYLAFNEISNVRCGMSSNPTDLLRIEGIMLKLENEKKRYQQMGRMDQMPYYNMPREHTEMYKSQNGPYPPQYYGQPPDHILYAPPKDTRGYGRPRYDEQHMSKMKSTGRYDKAISPKMFDKSPDSMSLVDKPYFVRDVNTFKITDKRVLVCVLSKEHNLLISVFDNRSIGSFNCTTMTNECIVETNGKQITSIKIKDMPDCILIVSSFDTTELMVIRYVVHELRFEMVGVLRGHKEKIACFDVADSIFSLDAAGIMKKWNIKGVCEREEILSGGILRMYSFSENCLILSDKTRTYLYDYEMNMEMSEISKGLLINLKKQDSFYILTFQEKVAVYDKGLNKVKVLTVPNNNIKSACFMDSDIMICTTNLLWYETLGRLNKLSLGESADVIEVENINKYKPNHAIVVSSDGECRLVCKCISE